MVKIALTTNLVSYWKSDTNGSFPDSTGSYNGTINGATYTASGKINGAYDYDGNTDNVSVGNMTETSDASAFTVSLWFNYDNVSQAQGFWGQMTNASNLFGCQFNTNTSKIYPLLYRAFAAYGIYDFSSDLVHSTWYHMVVVFDGSLTGNENRLKLFINASQKTMTYSGTIRSILATFTNKLMSLGVDTGTSNFDGKLDEIGMWNRALTTTEIINLYNGGTGLQYPFSTVLNSNSHIKKLGIAKTINSNSYINKEISSTITSNAQIVRLVSETLDSNYRIKKLAIEKTIISNALISKDITETITSDYHIFTTVPKTITQDAWLKKIQEKTITSNAELIKVVSKTLDSLYYVKKTQGGSIPNCIAYWKSDTSGSFPDTIGNYDGTINGASYTASGKINGAYDYDGATDNVNVGAITETSGASAFTISFWFNFDNVSQSQGLWSQYKDANELFTCQFNTVSNRMHPLIYNNATAYGRYSFSGDLVHSTWYHMVLVFDGTLTGNAERLKLYIDTTQKTLAFTGTIPTTLPALTGQNMLLGEDSYSANFNGKLDEIGMFNRALTQDEINKLYAGGSGIQYPFGAIDLTSDSYIKGVPSKTITSDYHIKRVGEEGSIISNYRIMDTYSDTITQDSYIKGMVTNTITSNADIITTVSESINSNYSIIILREETINSNSHIKKTQKTTLLDCFAYWKSDTNGSFPDETGKYNGTVYGGATYTASGKINGAYDYDGSTGRAVVGKPVETDSASALSVSLWFNFDNVSQDQYLFDRHKSSGHAIACQLNTTLNKIYPIISFAIVNASFGIYDYSSELVHSTWYHLVIVFDGTLSGNANRLKLFINGSQKTMTYHGNIPSTTSNDLVEKYMRLGYKSGTASYFNGKLDEIGMWDKALTQDEVKELYNSSSGLQYPFGACVLTSDAYIKYQPASTIYSNYRIKSTKTETLDSDYRIKQTYQNTINSNAHISITTPKNITSDADILKIQSQTLTSNYHIKVEGLEGSIVSNYRIKKEYSDTILQDAWINKIVSETITQDAHIFKEKSVQITCDAEIHVTYDEISCDYNILKTNSSTITSDSHIKKTDNTETVTQDAHIEGSSSDTITSDYHIFATVSGSIISNYRIKATSQIYINSRAYIIKLNQENIFSDYHIKVEGLEGSIVSNYWIKTTYTETVTSDYHILNIKTETILSDYNLASVITEGITSNYEIIRVYVPVLISPADGSTIYTYPPVFVWQLPDPGASSNRKIHSQIQLATDLAFTSLLLDSNSLNPPTNVTFEYWNGTAWLPYPSDGVDSIYYGNQARVTISDVQGGLKYWRVRLTVTEA